MTRNDELKNLTMKMLARLNAPRAVAGNTQAMKEEAEYLCKAVMKVAPTRGYIDWFDDFTDAVFGNLDTRSWPTSKDLFQAAKQIAPKRPVFTDLTGDGPWKPDPYKINAKRIKNREDVGECWINGKEGDRLIQLGYIVEEDLHDYREALTHMKK